MRPAHAWLLGLLLASVLSACSGGGRAVPQPPGTATTGAPASASQLTAQAVFSVTLGGGTSASSTSRSAAFIDDTTVQMCVYVTGPNGSPATTSNCWNVSQVNTAIAGAALLDGQVCQYLSGSEGPRQCTFVVSAPATTGSAKDHFAVVARNAVSSPNHSMSAGTVDASVPSGQISPINVTLSPFLSSNYYDVTFAANASLPTTISVATEPPCPATALPAGDFCGYGWTVAFDGQKSDSGFSIDIGTISLADMEWSPAGGSIGVIPFPTSVPSGGNGPLVNNTAQFISDLEPPTSTATPAFRATGTPQPASWTFTGSESGSHTTLQDDGVDQVCYPNTSTGSFITVLPTPPPVPSPPATQAPNSLNTALASYSNPYGFGIATPYPNLQVCYDYNASVPAPNASSRPYAAFLIVGNTLGAEISQVIITPVFVSAVLQTGTTDSYVIAVAENGQVGNTVTATASACSADVSLAGLGTTIGGGSTTQTVNSAAQALFTLTMPTSTDACTIAFQFAGQPLSIQRLFSAPTVSGITITL